MPHFLSSLPNCGQWSQEERSQKRAFVYSGAEVCTETLELWLILFLRQFPASVLLSLASAQVHHTWANVYLVPTHRVPLEQFVNFQFAKLYYFRDGSVLKNLPTNTGNTGDRIWSLGWGNPLQEGMATHCSVLAWRIPWTEEPGRLQSMGSQRVRQDWAQTPGMHSTH